MATKKRAPRATDALPGPIQPNTRKLTQLEQKAFERLDEMRDLAAVNADIARQRDTLRVAIVDGPRAMTQWFARERAEVGTMLVELVRRALTEDQTPEPLRPWLTDMCGLNILSTIDRERTKLRRNNRVEWESVKAKAQEIIADCYELDARTLRTDEKNATHRRQRK